MLKHYVVIDGHAITPGMEEQAREFLAENTRDLFQKLKQMILDIDNPDFGDYDCFQVIGSDRVWHLSDTKGVICVDVIQIS